MGNARNKSNSLTCLRPIPPILWTQIGYGIDAVFACVAAVLVIAAGTVTLIGPEARGVALDVLAPPEG